METLSEMSQEQVVLLSVVGVLLALVVLTLFVLIQLLYALNQRLAKQAGEEEETMLSSFYSGLTDAVPIAKEDSILLDHNYDGIKELDNHLPPWWKYLFYATMVFGVVYVFIYHIYGISPLQANEYLVEVEKGKAEVAAYQAKNANSIDENNVKLVADAKSLELGKTIFSTNCAACHGKAGEGTVGPNLTDDYWLHGNKVNDVFKTIKYGVPAKGMISWQAKLKPIDIQNVASYILSLRGTNPPNGKAPQGDKMEPAAATGDKKVASL